MTPSSTSPAPNLPAIMLIASRARAVEVVDGDAGDDLRPLRGDERVARDPRALLLDLRVSPDPPHLAARTDERRAEGEPTAHAQGAEHAGA